MTTGESREISMHAVLKKKSVKHTHKETQKLSGTEMTFTQEKRRLTEEISKVRTDETEFTIVSAHTPL